MKIAIVRIENIGFNRVLIDGKGFYYNNQVREYLINNNIKLLFCERSRHSTTRTYLGVKIYIAIINTSRPFNYFTFYHNNE